MLNKRIPVFRIYRISRNAFQNRVVRRERRTERIADVNGLALDNLDKGAIDLALGKIHLEIAVCLVENRLAVQLFVHGALEAFALRIQPHRLDFLTQFLFGRFLDKRKFRNIAMPPPEPHPVLVFIVASPAAADKAHTPIGCMPRILDFGIAASTHLIDIRLDLFKMFGINIVKPRMEYVFGSDTLAKPQQLQHGFVGVHSRRTAFVNFYSPKTDIDTVQNICRQRN